MLMCLLRAVFFRGQNTAKLSGKGGISAICGWVSHDRNEPFRTAESPSMMIGSQAHLRRDGGAMSVRQLL